MLMRLRDGGNPSTIRKEMAFLARVLRREGNRVFDNVRRPAEPVHPPRFMNRDQFDALIEVAPEERAFRCLLLAHTGARSGEAKSLAWANVNLRASVIVIRNATKGQASRLPYRRVPISPDLHDALKARVATDNRLLLPTHNNWRRDLLHDCKKAGIGHWRIHDLRHTYASWLAQGGISLHQIGDLMGHQSVTTTERYANLQPTVDQSVTQALGRLGRHGGDTATIPPSRKAV